MHKEKCGMKTESTLIVPKLGVARARLAA